MTWKIVKKPEYNYSIYDILTLDILNVRGILETELAYTKNVNKELIEHIIENYPLQHNEWLEYHSPIIFTAQRYFDNHREICEYIFKHPVIHVNLYDERGNTPLINAIKNNQKEQIRLLLDRPDIDVTPKGHIWKSSNTIRLLDNLRNSCEDGWIEEKELEEFERKIMEKGFVEQEVIDKAGQTAWDIASEEIRLQFPTLKPFTQS